MVQANFVDISNLDKGTQGIAGSTIEGVGALERWGRTVGAAGDVNGDGLADMLVATRQDSSGNGAVYVIYGSADGFGKQVNPAGLGAQAATLVTGPSANGDRIAAAATGIGDFNRDGFDDLLIIDDSRSPGPGIAGGKAYVVFGAQGGLGASVDLTALDGSNGFSFQSFTAETTFSNGRLGRDSGGFFNSAQVGYTDANGDGFSDIVIGNPGHSELIGGIAQPVGASLVIYGRGSIAGDFDLNADIGQSSYYYHGLLGGSSGRTTSSAGHAVAGDGDFNGDGLKDVLVGSPTGDKDGLRNQGEAFLLYGGTGVPGVASPADPDGRGALDAALPGTIVGQDGNGDPLPIPGVGFRVDSSGAQDRFGTSVAWAGDFNGDGFDDAIIGAPGESTNGTNAGAVYVLFGSDQVLTNDSDLDAMGATNGLVIHGPRAGGQFGFVVSSAGDFNGDGKDDILISNSEGATLAQDAAAWVIYGTDADLGTLDLSVGLAALEQTHGDLGFAIGDVAEGLGTDVMGLGDLNGDGYDDIGVSAPLDEIASIGSGLVHVIWGNSATMPQILGSAGNDTLSGTSVNDTLRGGGGDDTLLGDGDQAEYHDVQSQQVYRLYQATLDRAPDRAGHLDWTGRLADGAATLDSVAAGFVGSTEFQNVYGALSDTAFVELLYQNVLGRAADSAGLADWTARLGSGTSRAEVVTGFSESAEFINTTRAAAAGFARDANPANWSDEVFRVYRATLDRDPDAAGLLNWTGQLSNGRDFLSVIEGFTGSAEFQNTYGNLTPTGFVELLYRNVLNRAADTAGLADWTGRLAAGTSRSEVVRGFSESQEFIANTAAGLHAWMRAQGPHDTLFGGTGSNSLAGGEMSDLFVFDAATPGTNHVLDLETWDTVRFTGFGFTDAGDVRQHFTAASTGNFVQFVHQGTTVNMTGVSEADFTDDMILV